MRNLLLTTLLAGGLGACSGSGAPIPVRGDVAKLQGQWLGEYSSRESGRSGSIVFTLQAGTDTAYGDVVMVPAERMNEPLGLDHNRDARVQRPNPQALTIRFVQISGNQLMGELEEYTDPECGCPLTTTFTGKLNGNVLEGTYRSYHRAEQRTVTGEWRATRSQQK